MSQITAGAWLHNPVTGELSRINVAPADTGGRSIETDLWLQPGAAVAAPHVHDHLEERFEVVAGKVAFMVAGVERVLEPGDEPVTVAAGVAHDWWNGGESVAHARVRVRARPAAEGEPAARFVSMIEAVWSLGALGHVNAAGLPTPLWLAAIAREYRDAIRFLKPPRAVQSAVFGPLSVLARRMGRDPLAAELHGPAAACAIPAPDEQRFHELISRPVGTRAAERRLEPRPTG
jgi:mannose-6-phosphate isomerase-like protein (cupin superfamily)